MPLIFAYFLLAFCIWHLKKPYELDKKKIRELERLLKELE